ncbi:hypothetical protein M5D96_011189 [Drosophila gunungcola]|uniref:Uncharacterized protein n=1 Tax=Drosophila gunungcola TaxID=103775 RepID=A0A9Q0BLL1_9MUSC|nr:hypothetical protein M5D96_011189 [Drosophila gunungcola]
MAFDKGKVTHPTLTSISPESVSSFRFAICHPCHPLPT